MIINRSKPVEAFWTRFNVLTLVQSAAIVASLIFIALLVVGVFT